MSFIVFLTVIFGIIKENINIRNIIVFFRVLVIKLVGKISRTKIKFIIGYSVIVKITNYFGICGLIVILVQS